MQMRYPWSAMRGNDTKQSSMLCLLSPETVVSAAHPLRKVKKLADAALKDLSRTFDGMYSEVGRPSIPPERLLKATLLMALYTIRSERMFCEQLDYNLLFRWFLDMDMVEGSFDHSSFSRNRERLLVHDVAGQFFRIIIEQARRAGLMSDEHFTVDGTLIEAWASVKSFKAKERGPDKPSPPDDPGNPTVNFRGESRSNATHESTTDPEARLMRKAQGKEARLSYGGHALMENRNGLLVELRIANATMTERSVAVEMLDAALPGCRRLTLGGDKGYDSQQFVEDCRLRNVTPHVAQNQNTRRRSAIDGRATRQPGYTISQRIRKRVEEIFGWVKTVGNFRRSRFVGLERTQFAAHMVGAAYNLVRIAKLMDSPA